jgi:hypothetical protein
MVVIIVLRAVPDPKNRFSWVARTSVVLAAGASRSRDVARPLSADHPRCAASRCGSGWSASPSEVAVDAVEEQCPSGARPFGHGRPLMPTGRLRGSGDVRQEQGDDDIARRRIDGTELALPAETACLAIPRMITQTDGTQRGHQLSPCLASY